MSGYTPSMKRARPGRLSWYVQVYICRLAVALMRELDWRKLHQTRRHLIRPRPRYNSHPAWLPRAHLSPYTLAQPAGPAYLHTPRSTAGAGRCGRQAESAGHLPAAYLDLHRFARPDRCFYHPNRPCCLHQCERARKVYDQDGYRGGHGGGQRVRERAAAQHTRWSGELERAC